MSSFILDIPDNFQPTVMTADAPETWLPHMAVCGSIAELYEAMRSDNDLQLAVCFDPKVPQAATDCANWISKQRSLNCRRNTFLTAWGGWINDMKYQCAELLTMMPKDISFNALLDFCTETHEIAGKNILVAGFSSGQNRFTTQGKFHVDVGKTTLLHSFSLASTWHLPRGIDESNASIEQIRTIPVGATSLHRGCGSDSWMKPEISPEKQGLHAVPICNGRRATFAMVESYY